MTLKTDFIKLEGFISTAEALPKEKGAIPDKEFLNTLSTTDKLIQDIMTLIWGLKSYIPELIIIILVIQRL